MTLSLLGIFGAGLLTFLSPCVLPLAPILVASLLTADAASRWARLRATLWFALGFTTVFVLLGLSLPAVLALLGPAKPVLLASAAVVLALFGLKMLRVVDTGRRFAWMERSVRSPELGKRLPRGLQGLLFGAAFGLTWTPCVGPILGGVLTYVAVQQSTTPQSAAMLFAFAAGIAVPLLAIAAGADALTPLLRALRSRAPAFEAMAGVGLLVLAGLLLNDARLHIRPPAAMPLAGTAAVDDAARQVALGAPTDDQSRLVFFHSAHCPVCRAMEEFLPRFEADCASRHLQVVTIDVDRPENAAAAGRYRVRAVPTLSLLNPAGREVLHLVGYQTEARLRDAAEHFAPIVCASRDLPTPAFEPPRDDATCGLHKVC